MDKIFLPESFPVAGCPFEAEVMIKNIGRQTESNISVQFFLDTNNDSIPQQGELAGEEHIGLLLPADSQTVAHSLTMVSPGEYRIIAVVNAQRDDDTTNNMLALTFAVGMEQHSIVINEIMYAPAGNMPEWIEFYNASSSDINVGGWKISDASVKSKAVIANSQIIIQAGEYFLAASDSTLRGLFFNFQPRVCFIIFIIAQNNTRRRCLV